MRRQAAALVPVLALGFLTAPLVATGQPVGKVYRIGLLLSGTREQALPYYRVFEEGLRELAGSVAATSSSSIDTQRGTSSGSRISRPTWFG